MVNRYKTEEEHEPHSGGEGERTGVQEECASSDPRVTTGVTVYSQIWCSGIIQCQIKYTYRETIWSRYHKWIVKQTLDICGQDHNGVRFQHGLILYIWYDMEAGFISTSSWCVWRFSIVTAIIKYLWLVDETQKEPATPSKPLAVLNFYFAKLRSELLLKMFCS